MLSFDFPQICTTCQGYKTMPFSWNSTAPPRMCSCPKVSLSWECHRCGKINAPWKGSCNCTPTSLNWTPTCRESYVGSANPYLGYFPDTSRNINQDHPDLNKNFTDK